MENPDDSFLSLQEEWTALGAKLYAFCFHLIIVFAVFHSGNVPNSSLIFTSGVNQFSAPVCTDISDLLGGIVLTESLRFGLPRKMSLRRL